MLEDRSDIEYLSTKTYTHSIGLSACFRQWKAHSHCRFLHGYALEVKLTFQANELDPTNWVVDFGSLKSLKGWLEDTFDHKLLVAEDDPELERLQSLDHGGVRAHTIEESVERQLAQVRVVPATGCEAFSRFIFEYTEQWLIDNGYSPRCTLEQVEVREHAGNSAICRRKLADKVILNNLRIR